MTGRDLQKIAVLQIFEASQGRCNIFKVFMLTIIRLIMEGKSPLYGASCTPRTFPISPMRFGGNGLKMLRFIRCPVITWDLWALGAKFKSSRIKLCLPLEP